jgi:hypothetical protein
VPIVPFLPVVPVCKCCAVYYLRSHAHHGMEEVIGSIPIRSTKSFLYSFSLNRISISIGLDRFGAKQSQFRARRVALARFFAGIVKAAA